MQLAQMLILSVVVALSNSASGVLVQWAGSDTTIAREMAWRCRSEAEWISLWRGLFPSRAIPRVDWSRHEAIGIASSLDGAPMGLSIVGMDQIDETCRIVVGPSHQPLLHGTGEGYQYVIALVERTDSMIEINGIEGVTADGVVQSAVRAESDELPQVPLSIGDVSLCSQENRSYQSFSGSPLVTATSSDRFALAHVCIDADTSLFLSEEATNNVGTFTIESSASYDSPNGPTTVRYRIDGLQQTATVGSETFDLRQGNCLLIRLAPGESVSITQLDTVDSSYESLAGSARVIKLFSQMELD